MQGITTLNMEPAAGVFTADTRETVEAASDVAKEYTAVDFGDLDPLPHRCMVGSTARTRKPMRPDFGKKPTLCGLISRTLRQGLLNWTSRRNRKRILMTIRGDRAWLRDHLFPVVRNGKIQGHNMVTDVPMEAENDESCHHSM